MFRIAISVMRNLASIDGTTVRARRIIKTLRKQYQILVIERATSIDIKLLGSLNVSKNEIVSVGPAGSKLWSLKLIPAIARNRFHCVYCVADMFGFVTYSFLSRLFKYKIIFEAHALAYREIQQVSKVRAAIYFFLETFIGKNADAIVALSGAAFSFYRRLNENVFFIPVFVDDKVFKGCGQKHTSNMEKVVGLVGPFDIVPNKYQLGFLYSNFDRFDERIRFKIIGECDWRLSESRIEYTGYLESTEEYLSVLRELDALMVPVKIATFGPKNKILEAMACGVPVFTTYEGIVGLDFADPGGNIVVCQESELVKTINQLLYDKPYLEKVSIAARKSVRTNYSEKICSSKLSKIMSIVLEEDRKDSDLLSHR